MNNWLLLGKMTVACFEFLGWIYNSKGRKGNGFDGYGHGLILMFLIDQLCIELVFFNDHSVIPNLQKKLDIKNISIFKKKWTVPI